MSNDSKFIWMDGELVDAEKATIPFLNSALHYGAGVFEGIRCYNTDHGGRLPPEGTYGPPDRFSPGTRLPRDALHV